MLMPFSLFLLTLRILLDLYFQSKKRSTFSVCSSPINGVTGNVDMILVSNDKSYSLSALLAYKLVDSIVIVQPLELSHHRYEKV